MRTTMFTAAEARHLYEERDRIGHRMSAGAQSAVFRFETPEGPVYLREEHKPWDPFRSPAERRIKPRVWRPADILATVGPQTRHVPPLLHDGGSWMIVAGVPDAEAQPLRAQRRPEWLIRDMPDIVMGDFGNIERGPLLPLPATAGADRNSSAYMHRQIAHHTMRSHLLGPGSPYRVWYEKMRFERDSLSFARYARPWQPTPFGLVHNDLHPENILRPSGAAPESRETYIIDLDLAGWGPLTRSLAQHCAEFDYTPSQLDEIKHRAALVRPDAAPSLEEDFTHYRNYELELKATAAPMRVEQRITALLKLPEGQREEHIWACAEELTRLVNPARVHAWGQEPAEVSDTVRDLVEFIDMTPGIPRGRTKTPVNTREHQTGLRRLAVPRITRAEKPMSPPTAAASGLGNVQHHGYTRPLAPGTRASHNAATWAVPTRAANLRPASESEKAHGK
ncbi:phosphotransferase family protein [Uniformispora flossi]|uniref:phosphotransferase family protein n=1 Tax=Uniformispora flossi TaxID=3390723 RepID=UPI003C30BE96